VHRQNIHSSLPHCEKPMTPSRSLGCACDSSRQGDLHSGLLRRQGTPVNEPEAASNVNVDEL
jgi:hypothetical protein